MRALLLGLRLLFTAYGCTSSQQEQRNHNTEQQVEALKAQNQQIQEQLESQTEATQRAEANAQDAQDAAQDAQDAAQDAQAGLQPGTKARMAARIKRAQFEAETRCLADAECDCRKEGGAWVRGKMTVTRGAHSEPVFTAKSECEWR
ncbi:MAG: hypothetical protein ACREPU_00245 [Rhodanobacteraceae bacterium]